MAKKKVKPKVKNYKIILQYNATQYRYITATSLKDAKKKWEDGTWEVDEYDFDERCGNDDLIDIVEVK